MKVFLIHGAYGHPEENWFPWLKQQLEASGWTVFTPTFPTPENQSLESWKKAFAPYLSKIDEQSILVGHSLGPAFILSILEDLNFQIPACFFVAGFTGKTFAHTVENSHSISQITILTYHSPKPKNCHRTYKALSTSSPTPATSANRTPTQSFRNCFKTWLT